MSQNESGTEAPNTPVPMERLELDKISEFYAQKTSIKSPKNVPSAAPEPKVETKEDDSAKPLLTHKPKKTL